MKFIRLFCLFHCALQIDGRNVVDLINDTFYFDFKTRMSIDDVRAWRISKDQTQFKPLSQHESRMVFHSKGTVLVLTHKEKRTWHFYYWAGNEAFLNDKQTLVRYAMLFYLSALEYYDKILDYGPAIYISREQEGIETFRFKEAKFELMNRNETKECENREFYQSFQDAYIPSVIPNFYAVRGNEHSRVKKVSLHADWLDVADACLILEVGDNEKEMPPINVLCGRNASENAQLRSEKIGQHFYYLYEYKTTYKYDDSVKLKVENIIKAGNLHNWYEIDDPTDRHGSVEEFVRKCDDASLFYFDKGFTKHDIHERPIHSKLFMDEYGAYLLDTKSAAGLFLIIGESASDEMLKMVAEFVEEYIHKDTIKQIPIRVRYIKRNGDAPEPFIDFNIQLADWPMKLDASENLDSNPFW